MSLQNLLTTGQLAEHEADARQIGRLLAAAERGIADAGKKSISPESQLGLAYRAIANLAMAALWANGYRPSKSAPGHHQTMIQSLVHSIGLDRDEMLLLDTFRVKRNACDYTGAPVDEASAEACVEAASELLKRLKCWLAAKRPDLLA